jgi:hypothetical protein
MGVDLLVRSLSGVTETWWDAGGIFACPDTDSFSVRCQNREGHSPLAIHTAEFVHVLVLLAAGFALCFGESTNLTLLDRKGSELHTLYKIGSVLGQYQTRFLRS